MAKSGATERTEEEHSFCIETGKRIRVLREHAGLSQRALADLLGVDHGSLSLYESGQTDMPLSRLARLAKALNVSPALLIGGEGHEEWIGEVERALGSLKISHVRLLLQDLFTQLEIKLEDKSVRFVAQEAEEHTTTSAFQRAA